MFSNPHYTTPHAILPHHTSLPPHHNLLTHFLSPSLSFTPSHNTPKPPPPIYPIENMMTNLDAGHITHGGCHSVHREQDCGLQLTQGGEELHDPTIQTQVQLELRQAPTPFILKELYIA